MLKMLELQKKQDTNYAPPSTTMIMEDLMGELLTQQAAKVLDAVQIAWLTTYPLLFPSRWGSGSLSSTVINSKSISKSLRWKSSPACIKERLSTSAHTSQSPTNKFSSGAGFRPSLQPS